VICFHFVSNNQANLPIKRMCELVEVPRSSFYAWLNRTPSAREQADVELLDLIRDIHQRSRGVYGVPRIYGQLRRSGHRVARSRIARLMRANNLVGAHSPKKWRRGRPDAGGVPDLLTAGNAGMELSYGSTGDAYDNAAMETFWARLKVEITWIRGSIWFDTRAQAHAYLFEFIEVFYNRQRHQASLGHLTPTEYADKWRHDHGQPNLP
jgi:transposase InsO family protein